MTSVTPYQLNQAALNQLLNYITTDEFTELPAHERQLHLQRLKDLIKAVMMGEE